jgi:hypothetical protein
LLMLTLAICGKSARLGVRARDPLGLCIAAGGGLA